MCKKYPNPKNVRSTHETVIYLRSLLLGRKPGIHAVHFLAPLFLIDLIAASTGPSPAFLDRSRNGTVIEIEQAVTNRLLKRGETKMNTLRGWITTTCLVAMLMVSTMTANAGVIIIGATEEPCTPAADTEAKIDYGVIIAGFTGVIIAGFTGVIIAGATSEPVDNCGVIIAG
ncbi:MAG: hypothetical protein ABI857_08270 [Acidobacteriota bacterium]